MRKTPFAVLAVTALLGSVPSPAQAHHGAADLYDMSKPVTLKGTITKFEWTNPHAYIYLEVKGDDGKVVEWEVEMMSLNHLRGYGWTRSTVKPGDMIVADGDGVIVVPRAQAEEVARYAKKIIDEDKAARRRLYQKLGLPPDPSIEPNQS